MQNPEHKIILQTERLFLRQLTLDDIDLLCGIFSDPVAMQHYPKTLDLEETKSWIQTILGNYAKYGAGMWACHLKTTGEFVGQVGIHFHPDVDGQFEVEVGYLLLREYWHNGYATEAARASINYARDKLGHKRIISLIKPENTPSRRVAERNGLEIEKEITYKGIKCFVYLCPSE